MNFVYPVIYAGGTIGGIWFIVRLMVHFQQDFTNRYAERIGAQEKEITDLKVENGKLWTELGTARRETEACEFARSMDRIQIANLEARLDRIDPEGRKL